MKIEVLGSKKLLLSEQDKTQSIVGFIKLIPDEIQVDTVNHHILLADVSGSMSGHIKTLKERIKITLEALLQIPNSYVSVITYSGHSQSKRIISSVKCDQMSYGMSKVYETVERELYVKGVTVMSEPLEDAISICKGLAGICNKHHIALFTDGCLVPWNWSETIEEEKCFKIAQICNKEGIYLNAIGFGQYYDRRFLKELVEISGNGCVIHIDSVRDYSEVILQIINKVNSESITSCNLEVTAGKIFNISSSLFGNNMIVNSLGNKNIFALIDAENLLVDGNYLPTPYLNSVPEEVVDDFYYSLARNYLQNDDSDNYEFIIKMLGDIGLFEATQNCYSFIEKGNAISKVTEALENTSKRFLKGRKPIVEDLESEPLCVLEILQLIMNDKDSELYWDLAMPYHRITQATISIEDSIQFERQKEGLVPVTSIEIGSKKLNIGVKVRIPGIVTDTISGASMSSCVYRGYNIINGGNINVPYLNAKLSQKLIILFYDKGIIKSGDCHLGVYKISLNGIKSANKRILKAMSSNDIIDDLKTIADMKCKQWALNKIIKEALGDKEKVDMADLPIEEQELRKLLRIDESGIYHPLETEKDNTSPFEIYPAVHMTWDINKFPEKKQKEKHLSDTKDVLNNLGYVLGINDEEIYKTLNESLEKLRKEMRSLEFDVNCVRLASAITGRSPFVFDEIIEKSKTSTDKVLQRNMVVGAKIKQSKKTVNDDIVLEARWIEMTKCN